MSAEQPTAPYLDAVVAYGFRGSTRFHVPGHKGGPGADPALRSALGSDTLLLDVPQEIEGIDLGPTPTPYEEAERLAAEAYGAQRTWFLTNSATQGNHALCLAVAALGQEVLVQRNSHASVIDGLVLSGGSPIYIAPKFDNDLGIAHGVTATDLEQALTENSGVGAVFVVSPTYYGLAADIEALAEVAHAAEVALIVDQAWGSHFGFHPDLPPSALACGADATLTSTHKIVGSLTQTAMLHVAQDSLLDVDRLGRMVRLTRSTSTSSLLLMSLDAARRQLSVHGEALIARTLHSIHAARAAIAAVPGCELLDQEHGSGELWDPYRIAIDVRGTGCTGYQVAQALRQAHDLEVELATHALVVLVIGIAQENEPLERLIHDFPHTISRLTPGEDSIDPVIYPLSEAAKSARTPREAYLGASEKVLVTDAVGRISSESIAGYPPGIPALLPGEEITTEVTAYLRELHRYGAHLHGASDPQFQTIYVLKDG